MPLTIHSSRRSITASRVWSGQRGSGEDVLLLPGLGDDAHTLAPLADRLARGFRVTVLEPRGSGRSSAPPQPWSVDDFVADALVVLDRHEIESAHVFGTCLGAVVAQELAAAHPARVRSLVLNGTWLRSDVQFQTQLGSWIWAARQESYFADRRGFVAAARALRRYDATGRLRTIDAPTLLTVGARDSVRDVEQTRAVAAEIRDSRVEVIEGAGRRPYRTQPQAYEALVERFLTAAMSTVEAAAA